MADKFFNKIVYSASNEDSESERRALQITPADTILCITGSGARPLDLLIDSPGLIVSIDQNRLQNYLLELKLAAYKALDYEDFKEFIGLASSRRRKQVYKNISTSLPDEARSWWDNHPGIIEQGILYCGTWERLLRQMRRFFFPGKGRIGRLMNAGNLRQQQEIWKEEWDNPLLKLYLRIISNRFLWTGIIREPGARLIPEDFSIYSYLHRRLEYLVYNFELKRNHYANLLFYGYYGTEVVLPHHLRRENFNIIKENSGRIEIVTGTLSGYLDRFEDRFNAFSLSDFSSYTPVDTYFSTWEAIVKSAINNARFCERQFLVKRNPELKLPAINRKRLLEVSLNKFDETALYTFCAGNIIKYGGDE